jgi:hypothetical protein
MVMRGGDGMELDEVDHGNACKGGWEVGYIRWEPCRGSGLDLQEAELNSRKKQIIFKTCAVLEGYIAVLMTSSESSDTACKRCASSQPASPPESSRLDHENHLSGFKCYIS